MFLRASGLSNTGRGVSGERSVRRQRSVDMFVVMEFGLLEVSPSEASRHLLNLVNSNSACEGQPEFTDVSVFVPRPSDTGTLPGRVLLQRVIHDVVVQKG